MHGPQVVQNPLWNESGLPGPPGTGGEFIRSKTRRKRSRKIFVLESEHSLPFPPVAESNLSAISSGTDPPKPPVDPVTRPYVRVATPTLHGRGVWLHYSISHLQ